MTTHLLILLVVIPLVFAPVSVLVRKHIFVWPLVFTVSWVVFGIGCLLLMQVIDQGTISYAIGGWAAPWGIEYRLDILSSFILFFVTGIGAVTITYARRSVEKEIPADRIYLFYTAYLLNITGLLGVIVTGDIFNMFVFIEISSLSSYALISLGNDRRALLAAYRYLILGTIGATFILIGVGLLYVMTGSLNIMDIADRLSEIRGSRTVITSLAFLTVGISLKFALFPLHFWLPNAYTYAPSVISVFLASTTTKVFIYVLLRFLFSLYGSVFVFDEMLLDQILLVCALLAIFSGSISAIFQNNIKRMLAWSSVAQIGYMVIGISLVSITGLMAGIIHLFNHALMKSALFMCMGCVFYRTGSVMLNDMKGMGRRMPWTMAAFTIAGLSLIGIPPTVGFISKWFLVLAAIERGWWLLVVAIFAGSLLAIIYIWRVVEVAYFYKEGDEKQKENYILKNEAPLSMLVPLWILIVTNFWFGINAQLTSGISRKSAELLLGGF